MSERFVKSGWHALLVIAALVELRTARTPLRKLLIGAAAGWHALAAYEDALSSNRQDANCPHTESRRKDRNYTLDSRS